MEEDPHTLCEPQARWCQRGTGVDVGKYHEGLLAHRQQPNPDRYPLQRTFPANGVLKFLWLLLTG